MSQQKVIAFFPEAAYGPALNSVGIAQACEALGHKAVFLTDPGMTGVYSAYGFEEHYVNMSEPMEPEAMARFWADFVNNHIPNFKKAPIDQLDNYVKECWDNIVASSKWAQKELPAILEKVKPDLICVDNVILFPAIKQYGKPWVRIVSCSENEVEDESIPPYLSGMSIHDKAGHAAFRARFAEVIKPVHDEFNAFLAECGEEAYPLGSFVEASPYMNLLLYPDPVKFPRANPLPAERFHYLQGCVRQDKSYAIPEFKANHDKPLLYVSFGSLGSGDVELLQRLVTSIGKLPYRALFNVGEHVEKYTDLPDNVIVSNWYPQPSVIEQVDAVIHHGGNNSFTECLYFGKPAIVMPYVWDGHDNAMRAQESGHGFRMDRYDWDDTELADKLAVCVGDAVMQARLKQTSACMRARKGTEDAAAILSTLLEGEA